MLACSSNDNAKLLQYLGANIVLEISLGLYVTVQFWKQLQGPWYGCGLTSVWLSSGLYGFPTNCHKFQ